MDFKAQLVADMRVFHNPAEMATLTGFYYDRKWYEVPAVLDHEAAAERQRGSGDNAPGVSELEALVYVSLYDLGFMPEWRAFIRNTTLNAHTMKTGKSFWNWGRWANDEYRRTD